jgi:2-polyprenyl-3-methyl-5-hydroxy-6-metoxy-1,4-benzoquinol methylase
VEIDLCNLCGGANTLPLATGRRFGVEIKVVICSSCSLVYQNPRMSETELSAFYEHDYRRLYSGAPDEPSKEFLDDQKKRGEWILDFCSPWLRPGSQVLDVGCGAGGTLLPFRSAGHSVVGLEPGAYGKKGAEMLGLDIRQSTLEALAPGEVAPNLTILSFVLEHVPRPRQTLSDARKHASTGDCVFVEVPNLRTLTGWTLDQYFHVAHLSYFTPATLTALLRRTGWEVVKILSEGRYSIAALASATHSVPAGNLVDHLQSSEVSATMALVRRRQRRESLDRALRAVLRPAVRTVGRGAALIVGPQNVDATLRRVRSALAKAVTR